MPKNSLRIFRKILLVLFSLLYITIYPRPAELYSLRLFDEAEILFYTKTTPPANYSYINNGINYEIKTDKKGAEKLRQITEPMYQTAIITGDINAVLRYLGLCIIEKAALEGGVLYSGFSTIVKSRREKGINVQIYAKEKTIYIGSPLIFGSY